MTQASRINRDSYDAIAARWEQLRTRLSDAERRIFALLCEGLLPGCAILDLGCGTGKPVAEYLVASKFCVTGVDESPQMLAVARRLMPDQQWLLGDIGTFEPPQTFSAAIAWDSLFHIHRTVHESIFQRTRRALPVDGRFALTVGGSEVPAFTDTMFEREFFYDSHGPDIAVHLLKKSRFDILHTEFLNPPTPDRDKGRFAIIARAV